MLVVVDADVAMMIDVAIGSIGSGGGHSGDGAYCCGGSGDCGACGDGRHACGGSTCFGGGSWW